jgi:tetratricopeptide (TPR) repeat protein
MVLVDTITDDWFGAGGWTSNGRPTGYWQNSITLYEQALAVMGDNYLAHNNLGAVLVEQGRSDEAIEHYKQALKSEPKYQDAIVNLGATLIKKGQIDEAIRHYKDFLQHNSQDFLIHKNLADALLLREKVRTPSGLKMTPTTRINLDEAIRHYRQALRLKPDFAEARDELRHAQALRGKLDEVK